MSGPFTGYAPPGVYTNTTLDSAVGGLLANIRIPALIGTADEIKLVSGYELYRGSSATQDNKKTNEDVSGQATGTNRIFQVANSPIVAGDGRGVVTNNTNNVEVFVNAVKVVVAKVDGLTGQITLALAPKSSDTVTINYFYKKTDTKVIDEDLSDQADGSTTTFNTHHKPIVDGSNAGMTTTKVGNIIVKVNGAIVDVSNLDGANGAFTLTAPPASTDVVKVTYYFNVWANTADDLPYPGLTSVVNVGNSPDTSDYIQDIDFAIINNQIQWGTGYTLTPIVHTTGAEFFDDTQIFGTMIDDRMYKEDVSSNFTGVEKTFTVRFTPIVDGSGRDIVTFDPTTVIVTVNAVVADVTKVDGEQGIVTLKTAPAGGSKVLVSYWRSRVVEDTYAIEVVIPGTTGVGTYTITSAIDGQLGIAIPGASSVANPSFTGPVYLSGPTVSKGYTVDETVTLSFTSNTQFTVTSSVLNGSAGNGVTGSTYIDPITGLIFTLDVDALYASGDSLEIEVTKEAIFVTSVIPGTSVPGMQVRINSTSNIVAGDITDLQVFDKSGKEPKVGETYYMSYYYQKQSYECGIYTKFKAITNEYGTLRADNPLVLASYLMFLNGAAALILCQVQRAAGSDLASDQAYYDVLTRLQQDVDGINPAVIFPVTTTPTVINAVSQHCASQSSMRNRRERICFFGFAVGTEPLDAASFADTMSFERMISVYPDGATVEIVNPDGSVSENVVDGSFVAAAVCGLNVNPVYDVATPMTTKTITGFTQLVRSLDETTMDMVATKGVTLIQKISSSFVIRHGLTTNMSSALTREVMIITIRDFIQQETRRVLKPYIGRKMTDNLVGEVSTTLGSMLKSAVNSQIIVDYKGVSAERDSVQPDYITVSAFYVPIFGLNWVSVEYVIRVKF